MSQTDVIEKPTTKLKRPSQWAVVLHNDDVTPMDFVVELLRQVFNKNAQQATEIMLSVHMNGKGPAGIYSYEIAEQKYNEAKTIISMSGYSLKLSLEEE